MRVAIIGVGLIGGSLGMRLRAAGFVDEVVGCGRSPENLAVALERGCIDRAEVDPARAVADAGLVVVCTPVRGMPELFARLRSSLAAGAVVTDAGSVKQPVVAAGREAFGARFVGGHPIAGTERSGAAAAEADLFANRRWILTPEGADADAVARVERAVAVTGAQIEHMDAGIHDRIFAWVSHLPHLLSFALAGALERDDPARMRYGGGGLREFLRIAASDPVMWRDIFAANAPALRAAWDACRNEAEALLVEVEAERFDNVFERLTAVRSAVLQARPAATTGPGEVGS